MEKADGLLARLVEMDRRLRKVESWQQSIESTVGGAFEKLRQEINSGIERQRQMLMRNAVDASHAQLMTTAIRNCQIEVDALFYMLMEMDPDRFTLARCREFCVRAREASDVGHSIEAWLCFMGKRADGAQCGQT